MLIAYIVYGGLTALFAYLFYNVHSMENWKNKRIKQLENRVREKEEEILSLKYKIIDLKFENNPKPPQWGYGCNPNNLSKIPQGTIEAVKYAMKKSHPDNGGNAEDFMRFQKVYEELARK